MNYKRRSRILDRVATGLEIAGAAAINAAAWATSVELGVAAAGATALAVAYAIGRTRT